MKDVLGQFYVKRKSPPPLVPLCRLVPHEAVRFASDTASWLVSIFDTATYVETMGVFLVSLVGPSGSTYNASHYPKFGRVGSNMDTETFRI